MDTVLGSLTRASAFPSPVIKITIYEVVTSVCGFLRVQATQMSVLRRIQRVNRMDRGRNEVNVYRQAIQVDYIACLEHIYVSQVLRFIIQGCVQN